jgi:hypothetical protein
MINANGKYKFFTAALAKHLSEAEREGNYCMAYLYRSFLEGLLQAKGVDREGRVTITLDLGREGEYITEMTPGGVTVIRRCDHKAIVFTAAELQEGGQDMNEDEQRAVAIAQAKGSPEYVWG